MNLKTTLLTAMTATVFATSAATASIVGPFTVDAEGTADQQGNIISIDAIVTNQNPMALDFTDLEATLILTSPDAFDGTFILIGNSGNLFADVEGALFDLGGFSGTAGTFVVTGGTGQFTGFTGEGSFASLTNNADGFTRILIGGNLIPAPGVFAGLMLGGLITGRRRRD